MLYFISVLPAASRHGLISYISSTCCKVVMLLFLVPEASASPSNVCSVRTQYCVWRSGSLPCAEPTSDSDNCPSHSDVHLDTIVFLPALSIVLSVWQGHSSYSPLAPVFRVVSALTESWAGLRGPCSEADFIWFHGKSGHLARCGSHTF